MNLLAGRKGSLRWLALLSVVVTTLSSCVNATVDNKPADGYLHSGYFWPKTLYWRGIRHPPGIYWLVYFFFLSAALYSILGSCAKCSLTALRSVASLDPDDLGVDPTEVVTSMYFALATTALGNGILFISVAATNLSDVVQGYLIGMCVIQVLVDTLRSSIGCKLENYFTVTFTVISFQLSAVFGIALLDSYRPLNQLNATYSVLGSIVTMLIVTATLAENSLLKVAGFLAGLLQMAFCIAAYFIANHVAGVNKSQTKAFLVTAIVNFLLITLMDVAQCYSGEQKKDPPASDVPL